MRKPLDVLCTKFWLFEDHSVNILMFTQLECKDLGIINYKVEAFNTLNLIKF